MTARQRLIALCAVMIISASLAAIIFRPLRSAREFKVLDPAEMVAAEDMFSAALAQPGSNGWRTAATGLGLVPMTADGDWPGIVLAEQDGDCGGRGAYLLRDPARGGAAPYPVAITAPHRGSDRRTGTIAAQLFTEHHFAAAAWNSAPRRITDGCFAAGDLARIDTHFFTAFAVAFARNYPGGRIIQLHGFDSAKRSSASAAGADMIISGGTEAPGDRLLDLADCLSAALHPRKILVFPLETAELGALGNAQGRAVRAAGFGGFTHIEMAPALRQELATSAPLRASLARCLSGSQP